MSLLNIRSLFYVSLFFSVASLFSTKIGFGELYPFTSWKLFTQPTFTIDSLKTRKIYGISSKGDTTLLKIKEFKNFGFDDSFYAFHYFSSSIGKHTLKDKTKSETLRILISEMHPGWEKYLIVEKQIPLLDTSNCSKNNSKKVIFYF